MKILAISLLRLGDIFLVLPALAGLRRKWPGCEIHLLINKQFSIITPLLPFVDKIHHFDRKNIQEGLVDPSRPIFEPFDRLDKLIVRLNNENFDLLLNLTHTKATGWLASSIEATEKVGLTLSQNEQADFGSPWFKYLNNYVSSGGSEVFHYSDIFSFAAGIEGRPESPILKETERGKCEANKVQGEHKNWIAVQPYTSDVKKDWSEQQLISCLAELQTLHASFKFAILGAPFEADKINGLVSRLEEQGVGATAAICSLEGAVSILNNSKVLLTGDTSIKHLACGTSVKIVELSLGSSDYRKTGVFKEDSVIIQSKESCTPCSHLEACHRDEVVCGKRVSPELVSAVVSQVVKGDAAGIGLVATEFANEAEVLRTLKCDSGFWLALPVGEYPSSWTVERILTRSAWKFFLDQDHKESIAPYGSEGLLLNSSLAKIYPSVSVGKWKKILQDLESQIQKKQERIEGLHTAFGSAIKNFGDREGLDFLLGEVNQLSEGEIISVSAPLNVVSKVARATEFSDLRKVNASLEDMEGRSRIKMKLVRTLLSQIERSI